MTDLPRLIYVDPSAMEYKGTIPWTVANPVSVKKLSATKFDVVAMTEAGERAYHLTALEPNGCDEWVEAINKLVNL
jgi:hypothetical protein